MRIINRMLLSILIVSIVHLVQCGGETETELPEITDESPDEEQSGFTYIRVLKDTSEWGDRKADWIEIIRLIDEVLTRMKYRDKSGLWDNEFQYLRERENFDDYLKRGEVQWANVTGLIRVDLLDIKFFDMDSALAKTEFYFTGMKETDPGQTMLLMLYRRDNHWIRPYVATIEHQLEYDELIRKADQDTEDDW